jgi:putative MATE family efflux protein
MLLAVGVGAAVGAVLYMAAPAIAMLAGLKDDALQYTVLYLRIVTVITPFTGLLLIGNACLRGAGETRIPFLVMVIANVVNVVASVLLVYGPEPIGGHGVGGIAVGTLIAFVVGGSIIGFVLIRGSGGIRLRWVRLRPHMHTIWRLLRVGVPNLLEVVGGTWLATFIVLAIVGRLGGSGIVGSHMIAVRVESFSFQPGFALGIAAATLTGQYLGLGDPVRARQAVKLCWMIAAGSMTLMGLLFLLIPAQLAGLLTDSPTMIAHARDPIRICGTIQVFFATYLVCAQALRGAGDTRTTMVLTWTSVFVVRVPGAYILGMVLGWGLPGVWLALCGDLMVRGLLFGGRFLLGGWEKVEV